MSRWRGALSALWPRRLAAQLIALLLFALVASQVVSLVILLDERRHALRSAERAQVLARTASIVRLVEATPPELHPHILRTASSPRLRFWVDDANAVDGTVEAHRHNPRRRGSPSCSTAAPSRSWPSSAISRATSGTGSSDGRTRMPAPRRRASAMTLPGARPRPPSGAARSAGAGAT